MAIIDPVGIDLPSGQYKRVTGGDTLRPESGDLTVSGGTGGDLSLTGGNLSLTAGGNVGISAGGFTSATDGGVSMIAGNGGSDGNFYFESKGTSSDSFTFIRNPGTPTASLVFDDNALTLTGVSFVGNIGSSATNVNVESPSGNIGGDGTRLYITPNLGIILELGNTIKIDPDGTNNWIYGDDGAAATNPGEPLTLRGGHGNTSGNGAALKLRGGDGGSTTGNGGGVELTPGATTGGTAGTVSIGTATANLLRFYGTAAGTAQQTVAGSRGGNAALADLLTKLATLGIIVDSTTA